MRRPGALRRASWQDVLDAQGQSSGPSRDIGVRRLVHGDVADMETARWAENEPRAPPSAGQGHVEAHACTGQEALSDAVLGPEQTSLTLGEERQASTDRQQESEATTVELLPRRVGGPRQIRILHEDRAVLPVVEPTIENPAPAASRRKGVRQDGLVAGSRAEQVLLVERVILEALIAQEEGEGTGLPYIAIERYAAQDAIPGSIREGLLREGLVLAGDPVPTAHADPPLTGLECDRQISTGGAAATPRRDREGKKLGRDDARHHNFFEALGRLARGKHESSRQDGIVSAQRQRHGDLGVREPRDRSLLAVAAPHRALRPGGVDSQAQKPS